MLLLWGSELVLNHVSVDLLQVRNILVAECLDLFRCYSFHPVLNGAHKCEPM